MKIDAITVSVIQKRLDNIALQMGWVMLNTARSPIFSQSHDFSCFIADKDGYVVTQADGLPIHTGGGGFAVRKLIGVFGEDIGDGDIFLLNDPYAADNNHLPDWTLIKPVFIDRDLCAFICNRAHQSDIGGGAAGTYNAAATEIFHEGIRIPPIRYAKAGRINEDIRQLLLLNTRTPDLLEGDLEAMLGSLNIGAIRLSSVFDAVGKDSTLAAFGGVLDHGERMMRDEIAHLPDGVYCGDDKSDTDCFEEQDIHVRVSLVVSGDRLIVDFTGTDPQTVGFKNSNFSNTVSSVSMALNAFLGQDLPKNEGLHRCFEVIAPEGSMVNCLPPAAVTMSTVYPAANIIHAVWQALSQADPERACAGWGKTVHSIASGRGRNGNTFVMYHWHASVASGAVKGRDGINTCGQITSLGARTLPNVESYEQLYPVRIRSQEFRMDGGGAGRFRGGTGIGYVVDLDAPASHSFRGEGYPALRAFGVNGGGEGVSGDVSAIDDLGQEIQIPRYGNRRLPAVRMTFMSPGGGGWGDPLDRPMYDVLADVANAIVSRKSAELDYGVIVGNDGDRPLLDIKATELRRREMKSERDPVGY